MPPVFNRMSLNLKLSTRTLKGILLACLFLAVFAVLALAMLNKPAPWVETEFGGATVQISADRAWFSAPGDCVTIQWEVEGIKSIYIDSEGMPGWGEMPFCPTASAVNILEIGITAQDGTRRIFQFDIVYLPNFIVYLLGFVGIASTVALALYYVWNYHLDNPFPLRRMLIAVLGLTLVGGLNGLSSGNLITDALSLLRILFAHPYWHLFGIILSGIIYLPLIVQTARRNLKSKSISDLIVIGGFLLFVFLLYLPFGFESIGHWEEWVVHAYLDGKPAWKIEKELFIRFWAMAPHTLAYLIDSESFLGYHLVNFLMFWGKLVLLYGILRQLKLPRLYAFLTTMLFMVYPVNSGLMSLRSLPMQFSMISLLAAVYLVLDYQKHPTRLHLLGIWLGLLFNVASNESAYVIILIIPLLWWLRRRELTWKNFNPTVIWYTFPALKAAYLLLLLSANRTFYRDEVFNTSLDSPRVVSDVLTMAIPNLVDVYRNTFVDGWQRAWSAVEQNTYMALTVVMLALVGGIALYLLHAKDADTFPSARQIGIWLVSGLLLIMPAVGVLIWIEQYSDNLWRLYFYVPIAAAMVIFSLIVLLTVPIARPRYRNAAVIILCLVLMFPALSRLFLQHEHFVNSANRKAALMRDILEIAPQVAPDTILILVAEMSIEQLAATDLADYHKFDLVRSILYTLYQPHPPAHAALCLPGPWCSSPRDRLEPYSASGDFIRSNLPNMLLLKVHEDLSVELVEQPAAYFGFDSDLTYDAGRLYNPDAPLPPRAATMLGAAPMNLFEATEKERCTWCETR